MDLAELTAQAQAALSGSDFDKTVKFDFGDFGTLFLDGAKNIANNDADAPSDATIRVAWEDFKKLAKGELDPTMAFMQGKLKVEGDMSVVMQLQSILSKLK